MRPDRRYRLVAPGSRLEAKRILKMVRSGIGLRHMAWALGQPVTTVETRLRILLGMEREGRCRAGKSRHDRASPMVRTSVPVRSRVPKGQGKRASPRDLALSALPGRAAEIGGALYLDGDRATLADLVTAAAARGVFIDYPGVRPLDKAFHSGPSAAPRVARRRPIRRTPTCPLI